MPKPGWPTLAGGRRQRPQVLTEREEGASEGQAQDLIQKRNLEQQKNQGHLFQALSVKMGRLRHTEGEAGF
jgi:hypothetical protein